MDKRIVLIDDSIMRGTTSKKLIKMMRRAGVKEIHLRISAPPTKFPCYYGIDIPTRQELIAATHTIDEIKSYLQVDSLGYMSIDNAREAVMDNSKNSWCDACFSGEYPLPFVEDKMGNQKDLFTEYAVEENRV
jgi:amidophosphoribosyltransferase